MNSELDNIRRILSENRAGLMNKPNVTATGIGYKTVSGQLTDELAIICSVEVKVPRNRLLQSELIPDRIQQIPTDVNPTGVFRAFQDPKERFRPAPGGVSIGHTEITAGTLGCLVQKDGEIYILSNNHVLANSNEASFGDPILQPGPHDGGREPEDQLAELSDFIQIHFEDNDQDSTCTVARLAAGLLNILAAGTGSSTRLRAYRLSAYQAENRVDAAIARPLAPEDVKNEILQIGSISGLAEGELDMEVKKSGRTTGFTTGTIQQVDVTARVNYGTNKVATFTDQLMADGMSQGGDSGSMVLDNDNNLVGLLFAGSDTTTLMNRIDNVFEALDLALPSNEAE